MDLANIADELTTLTGSKWAVTTDKNNNQHLTRVADGLQFWLRSGGYGNEGKACIRFDRPLGRDGRSPTLYDAGAQIGNPFINVSLTKSDEQIAKDIVRRLLDGSVTVFKLANEAIARDNNYLDGKVKTTLAIAALCGTPPERHYQSKELTFEVDPFKGAGVVKFDKCGYGKITISSENSVNIELVSVPLDVASEMVVAIRNVLSKRTVQA